jgi:hypothetical protein
MLYIELESQLSGFTYGGVTRLWSGIRCRYMQVSGPFPTQISTYTSTVLVSRPNRNGHSPTKISGVGELRLAMAEIYCRLRDVIHTRGRKNILNWSESCNDIILLFISILILFLFIIVIYRICQCTEWCKSRALECRLRAAAHQLRQDKHQDMRQKKQKLTSASWLRPVCGDFYNLIRFNCAPFFASCRRHRVLTVTCLDAYRCAAYLKQTF